MSAPIGLSNGSATAFTDLAAVVRFWMDGTIQARNSGAYQAASDIPYTAGVTYHFRLVVSIPAHTYSAYVRQGTAAEQLVGSDYAFRTEQSGVTTLDNVGFDANIGGSVTVCNVTVTAPTSPPPPPSATMTSLVVSPATVSLQTGATQQLTAKAIWSDGGTYPFTVAWSATGGAITTAGLYTAGMTTGSSYRVIGASNGLADTAAITITSPPMAAGCPGSGYLRLVNVSTAAQLTSALNAVLPGDQIRLAAGTYSGHWSVTRSGTTANPWTLCGPRTAILNGGTLSTGGAGLKLTNVNRAVLKGFTLTNSLVGLKLVGSSDNRIDSLTVTQVGQAAITLQVYSRRNVIVNNAISYTGRYMPGYGEGIYIGTAYSHWCADTNCQPDTSDYNEVLNNVFGPNVTSENVDAKTGTSYGLLQGNTFSGVGMSSNNGNGPTVAIKGNYYQILGNKLSVALTDGFQTVVFSEQPAWGHYNTFAANTVDKVPGYGLQMASSSKGNVVKCTNIVTNAGKGFANVQCQ